MRVLALSIPIAAVLMAAPVSAQSFLGQWRASAESPNGLVSETLTVEKAGSGYSVTSTDVEPPNPPGVVAGNGVDVRIDGDTFSYKRIVNIGGTDIEVVYKGMVSGDSFTGTAEIQGFSVPYNGVRLNDGG